MTPDAGFEDDVAVLIYRHPPEPLRMRVSAQDPSCLAAIRAGSGSGCRPPASAGTASTS